MMLDGDAFGKKSRLEVFETKSVPSMKVKGGSNIRKNPLIVGDDMVSSIQPLLPVMA